MTVKKWCLMRLAFTAPPLMPRRTSTKRGSAAAPVAVQQSNYENIVLPRQPSLVRLWGSDYSGQFVTLHPSTDPTRQAAAAEKSRGQAQTGGGGR